MAIVVSLARIHQYLRNHKYLFFFFFNDTATTEIYTLSLHDALPISHLRGAPGGVPPQGGWRVARRDRKSTRLNSSHSQISYAVFCLKKKKNKQQDNKRTKRAVRH